MTQLAYEACDDGNNNDDDFCDTSCNFNTEQASCDELQSMTIPWQMFDTSTCQNCGAANICATWESGEAVVIDKNLRWQNTNMALPGGSYPELQ